MATTPLSSAAAPFQVGSHDPTTSLPGEGHPITDELSCADKCTKHCCNKNMRLIWLFNISTLMTTCSYSMGTLLAQEKVDVSNGDLAAAQQDFTALVATGIAGLSITILSCGILYCCAKRAQKFEPPPS